MKEIVSKMTQTANTLFKTDISQSVEKKLYEEIKQDMIEKERTYQEEGRVSGIPKSTLHDMLNRGVTDEHIISLLYVWKRSYISCEGLPVFSNS